MPAHCTSATPASNIEPSQSSPATLTVARTKNGCWTCRLRKKKCDDQHTTNMEGDMTCQTCHRLYLQCIGGRGNKRDKELRRHVTSILTSIKQHLGKYGLNRRARRLPFLDPIPILKFWPTEGISDIESSTSTASTWDGSTPPPLTPTTVGCDDFKEMERENIFQGNMVPYQHIQALSEIHEYEHRLVFHPAAYPSMGEDGYPSVQPPSPEQVDGLGELESWH